MELRIKFDSLLIGMDLFIFQNDSDDKLIEYRMYLI